MRSFSREHWLEAQELWKGFSDEWKPYRHQAAMRGMLYPPEGTAMDSWDDPEPSQRAMLIRAIRETPKLLTIAISRSKSWGGVIEYILSRRDEMRADYDLRFEARDEATPRDATMTLKSILSRIEDS